MENKDNAEVVVNDGEENNESVETNEEVSEETTQEVKPEKTKRTPQEEYEYHMGRAKRAAKKAGIEVSDEKSTSAKQSASDKPNDLDLGGIAYLNSLVGLKGKDEVALAREYISAGKSVLDLPDNKFFKQDLQALREARESTDAIPKSSKRSGQTAVTNIDIAVAKYKETGVLPADFETRNKVVDVITKAESGALFS